MSPEDEQDLMKRVATNDELVRGLVAGHRDLTDIVGTLTDNLSALARTVDDLLGQVRDLSSQDDD